MLENDPSLHFDGHVTQIDKDAGVFYARLELPDDNGNMDDYEVTIAINQLSPVEYPLLTEGAYLSLYPNMTAGEQVVFSKKTWTQEAISAARAEGDAMYQRFSQMDKLTFPLDCSRVIATADSMSFQRTTLGVDVEIPTEQHVGAFAVRRKHHVHEGVDLYGVEGQVVRAMEDGIVVNIAPCTGPKAGFPWWLDTDMILIEGSSGVLIYGEISVLPELRIGDTVVAGQKVGALTPVLSVDKGRPTTMLHLERYVHGTTQSCGVWPLDMPRPAGLLDPTELLLYAAHAHG